MTTYEYTCNACLHKWLGDFKFPAPQHPVCPHCDSRATRRVYSVPDVHFKGDGWTTKTPDDEEDGVK